MSTCRGRFPEAQRLEFREMNRGDLADLSVMFADADARRFYPQMEQRAHVQGWIDWNLDNYARHGFGLWALTCRATGAFIGDCGLTYQKIAARVELEIGYHISAAYRRKGYAQEAGRAALRFGFAETDASLICSKVAPLNAASVGVARRLHGYQAEYRNERGEQRLVFYSIRPGSAPPPADWLVSA